MNFWVAALPGPQTKQPCAWLLNDSTA